MTELVPKEKRRTLAWLAIIIALLFGLNLLLEDTRLGRAMNSYFFGLQVMGR